MRYERVKIKRDTNTVHNKSVVPWEVPVLEYIFEDGNVERLEQYETTSAEYPTAAEEFDRLTKVYGADSKSGIPHVVSVYGGGNRGLRELKRAIDEAEAAERAAAPRSKSAARKGRVADPLMA